MRDEMLHRFSNAAAIVGHDRGTTFSGGDKDQRVSGCDQVLQITRPDLGV
jgi:hypothetical protein